MLTSQRERDTRIRWINERRAVVVRNNFVFLLFPFFSIKHFPRLIRTLVFVVFVERQHQSPRRKITDILIIGEWFVV